MSSDRTQKMVDRIFYVFDDMCSILNKMEQTWEEYKQFAIEEGYIDND